MRFYIEKEAKNKYNNNDNYRVNNEEIAKFIINCYQFRNEFNDLINFRKKNKSQQGMELVNPYYTFTKINGKSRKIAFIEFDYFTKKMNSFHEGEHLINVYKFQNRPNDLMSVNIKTNDFKQGDGLRTLKKIKYEIMINDKKVYKIDISNFYESIYTHNLENIISDAENKTGKKFDSLMNQFNSKKTMGIVVGPGISLFAANTVMSYLAKNITDKLNEIEYTNKKNEITTDYFSDQFYIYSKNDIINIFEKIESILSNNEFFYKLNYNESYEYKLEDVFNEIEYYSNLETLLVNGD